MKFPKTITKRNRLKKFWVDQETEFAGEFKKFCSAEKIETYSTMLETKAAFAEPTIRSIKNILYRYMEDCGNKYIHKLPHFIATMNSGNNRSIYMKPNYVKVSDFMSILHTKPLRDYKKLELETEFTFPCVIYRSQNGENFSLHRKFLKLLPLY